MGGSPPPLTGYLGAGSVWTGDLSFEGRVRVDGTFRGRIYTDDVLEVGPSGVVEGQVDVARAVVAGLVEGTVRVREHLQVESTGVIRGDLTVARMHTRPGARVDAQVTHFPRERRR